jgi:predicted glycogen debranching enzyme
MIDVSLEDCRNLDTAVSREWLETNGLGGFASSTVIGLNARRYHGLLTAATKPPVGRFVLLSKLEEVLVIDERRYELSANQYPGVVQPQGYNYQAAFRLDPFPVFSYEVEGVKLEKTVFMVQGENTTVVQYHLSTPENEANDIKLELRPLIAFRDYHSTTHENSALNPNIETEHGLVTFRPYSDLPPLHLAHDSADIDKAGFWYRSFQYAIEQERGLDFSEDLFSPCAFTFNLIRKPMVSIIASTERRDVNQAETYRRNETNRRVLADRKADQLVNVLSAAAEQFIVARERGKTVIAGYHWFADWGRDTMIALPGLTLATGRADVAKGVLREFANHVDQGMLPNRFPDAGESPEYNTVDATLWFFEAVRSLLEYTNDYDFVRTNLYAVLKDIIDWHVKGTRYQIHVDDDGLLYSGEPGVQLTWMDAKVGEWVVTPRQGKPVEIQALWYNALRVMEELATRFKDEKARSYAGMADKALATFNEKFWNEQTGCLFDVVNGETRDASIRPNQVIAVSLPNSMLSKDRAADVLRVVERDLLTPRGVRTLSPKDPNYIGRYEGDPRHRDGAYHQGTVWPWLIGPYITAYIKTFGKKAGRKFAMAWLEQFQAHLNEACLGQVSEIFDGDAPHTPRGCIAQAWSVSELLKSAIVAVNNKTSSRAVASSA